MATDFIATIIATPYLLVPIVAWLWKFASLPKVDWSKVAAGLVMILSANFIGALATAFEPYATMSVGSALMALFSLFGIVANLLGLAIVGFYLFVDGLLMWKVEWPF